MTPSDKLEKLLSIIKSVQEDSYEWKSHGILYRIMKEYNEFINNAELAAHDEWLLGGEPVARNYSASEQEWMDAAPDGKKD